MCNYPTFLEGTYRKKNERNLAMDLVTDRECDRWVKPRGERWSVIDRWRVVTHTPERQEAGLMVEVNEVGK